MKLIVHGDVDVNKDRYYYNHCCQNRRECDPGNGYNEYTWYPFGSGATYSSNRIRAAQHAQETCVEMLLTANITFPERNEIMMTLQEQENS